MKESKKVSKKYLAKTPVQNLTMLHFIGHIIRPNLRWEQADSLFTLFIKS
jgi:hypothetical protein